MNADQTWTLSEPISSQKNGIILCFSFFDSSTGLGDNTNWTHHFVPKKFVELHSGSGTLFNFVGLTGGNRGAKYLYITDTTITGHASNGAEGMTDGLVYYNNKYCLRYVIGV